MERFSINVYDKYLNYLGTIDDFSSLRWRRKYFEAGEFELHLSLDNDILRYLKEDNIFVREDAIEAGIVESIIMTDNGDETTIQVIGRFLSSILDRRIIKSTIKHNGTYLDGERKLLESMVPFSNLIIEDTDIQSENVVFRCTYKNVYNYLKKLAQSSNVAHRIVPDFINRRFIYQNYVGLDRTETQTENTRYEFSEDRGNLDTSEYSFSSRQKKNYTLVGGRGEGKDRVLVEVKKGIFTDFDLRETFINASQEQQDEETSDEEYRNILINKGMESLLDSIESIDVSTYADDYKKNWDLGDIVNVKKESWGITIKRRITEVEEIIENNKQEISVVLGNPLPEKLVEDDE